VNITTLVVVSFLFLVPTAVILYIASHRVPIEETEIEDNKNKIVITPQQVFSRDPWSVACERLNKRDDDEKKISNDEKKFNDNDGVHPLAMLHVNNYFLTNNDDDDWFWYLYLSFT